MMSVLEVVGLSHSFGDHVLYQDASLKLNKGEHMGLVGPNGCGKSTLLKIIDGSLIPDAGRVCWLSETKVGCLDQYAQVEKSMSAEAFLHAAFESLYAAEKEMLALYAQMAEGDVSETVLARTATLQDSLEQGGFYEIETRISQVVQGLGLAALGLKRPLAEMSGGQRAKVILAKLLLSEPDVMILDEPTNFLDKAHIEWLADFLEEFEGAFIVVSHDEDFLQQVTTCICDIDAGALRKYYGNYAAFVEKKTFQREDYVRRMAAQQRMIKKTEAFIRKNQAGRNAKMARGRQKQLDRLERLAPPAQEAPQTHFHFQALPATNAEHLVVSRLAVGYQYPLLRELDFCIHGGQKVVLTGFNGIGKSTLLKTLVGALLPLAGSYLFSEQVTLGYFSQDLSWVDARRTPLEIVSNAYPRLVRKLVRRQLAQCGLASEKVMQSVGTLSGGEQKKVKLCLLTLAPCNFLILDEPTNHLDKQAKAALREALMDFSGTVLLVSHEEAFYRGWVDKVIDLTER